MDPFWRGKYGQLRPWEQRVVAALVALWEPIAVVFAKPPPKDRVKADVERPDQREMSRRATDGEDGYVSQEQQALMEAAEEFAKKLAEYGQATPMVHLGAGLAAIAPALEECGKSIFTMAQQLRDERPVNDDVIEGVEDVGHCLTDASQVAEELEDLFNSSHEVERERILHQRPNEEQWDIRAQDDEE
ncbi:hypothetical protein DEF23_23235 [Marinitenerispora sediminis]|nr:hypothetical protein DEF23_23235 [Marinitenerispora sediminis]